MTAGRHIVLDCVDSTQDEARRRYLEGELGPLWILARSQTAGRGRRQRSWRSARGNLHLSLLFVPPARKHRWPELSLLAALVAHKALARLAVMARRDDIRAALSLKWPNDLLLHGRKLGGVLPETVHDGNRQALVIGWGINLAHAPADTQVRWPATALCETGLPPPPPEVLFPLLRDTFWRWHHVWHEHGFSNVRDAWRRRVLGLGGQVSVRLGNEMLRGRFADIGPAGELELELTNGERRMLRAGEVVHVSPAEWGGN